jgi:endogenous inhibitor of DNA gyrase (YacG/DUF329 family)
MPRCMICREPIAKSAIGRPQTYCSARCRSAAYRLFERARKELFSEELVERNDDVIIR